MTAAAAVASRNTSDLLDQGVPLEDVQTLVGHSQPQTTALYGGCRCRADTGGDHAEFPQAVSGAEEFIIGNAEVRTMSATTTSATTGRPRSFSAPTPDISSQLPILAVTTKY